MSSGYGSYKQEKPTYSPIFNSYNKGPFYFMKYASLSHLKFSIRTVTTSRPPLIGLVIL